VAENVVDIPVQRATDSCVVQTAGLRKSYDGFEALRGLDLEVPRGSITGFLGRNGAGKTTAIKILLGMTHPTAGLARVLGFDAAVPGESVVIRRRTGFVSEEKELYDFMTVEEMIRFTAPFFPRWRKDLEQRYLRVFGLPPGRKVKALSRGTRTKLALLLAFCRGGELLVLDEPTSGLDPASAEEVLQALVELVAGEEMTVLFSSHQIAEVEQVADRVVIIDQGRAVVAGVLDDLRESFCRIRLVFEGPAPNAVFRSPGVERVKRDGRVLTILSSRGAEPVVAEAEALHPATVEVVPVTLKEIFLESASSED
jgi:ABC-2 type transport system ATP-binding protein